MFIFLYVQFVMKQKKIVYRVRAQWGYQNVHTKKILWIVERVVSSEAAYHYTQIKNTKKAGKSFFSAQTKNRCYRRRRLGANVICIFFLLRSLNYFARGRGLYIVCPCIFMMSGHSYFFFHSLWFFFPYNSRRLFVMDSSTWI